MPFFFVSSGSLHFKTNIHSTVSMRPSVSEASWAIFCVVCEVLLEFLLVLTALLHKGELPYCRMWECHPFPVWIFPLNSSYAVIGRYPIESYSFQATNNVPPSPSYSLFSNTSIINNNARFERLLSSFWHADCYSQTIRIIYGANRCNISIMTRWHFVKSKWWIQF